jgi:hypothetical protein
MSGSATMSATEAWCRTTSQAVSDGAGCGEWGALEAGRPRQGWEEKFCPGISLLNGFEFWSYLSH